MDQEQREFRPVMVRNRDIPLLAEVLCTMQEVEMLEQQKDWQRERLTSMSQRITGMPSGGGLPQGLDEKLAELFEVEEIHLKRFAEYGAEIKRAEEILNGIQSRSMRVFVIMKYVFDIPDTDIRDRLNMTRRGFEKARRAVEEAPDMAHVKWQEKYVVIREA